jgi:hypothetical protein
MLQFLESIPLSTRKPLLNGVNCEEDAQEQ